MDRDLKWRSVDAWMLAAVDTSWRGVRLYWLLVPADHYNHALPSEGEFKQGLSRLTAPGFVAQKGLRFAVTPAGRAIWKQSAGDGYDRVATLLRALLKVSIAETSLHLDPGELGRAYERYARSGGWRF